MLGRAPLRLPRRASLRPILLGGILLLGLGLRFEMAGEWNAEKPPTVERLTGDEPEYDQLAQDLRQRRAFDSTTRAPLYPLLLAGVHELTEGSYPAVPYVQSVLSLITVVLTFVLARRLFGNGAGLVAALLAATSFALIHQPMRHLTEVLFTPFVLAVALLLTDAVERPTIVRLLAAGAVAGLANYVRPTLVLFPLAAAVLFAVRLGGRRGVRAWAVFALAVVAVDAPWVARQSARHATLLPMTTSAATVWQGSPEYVHLVRDRGMPYLQVWTDVLHGPGAPAYGDGLAWDRYWTRRGLRSIRSEPDVYLRYATEKLGTFWVGDPHADWANTRVFNEEVLLGNYVSRPRDVTLLMLSRVTPIVAAGAVLTLLRLWRVLLPVLALLAYATLLHAATHAEARLSEPFHPLLFVLIAGAAATLGGDVIRAAKGVLRRVRRRTPGPAAGGAGAHSPERDRAAPERDPDAPWESWVAYEPGLVPPLRMMREEGIEVLEDWFRWAEEWNVFLRAYGGVGKDSRVLEIGCGLGRIAYPLRLVLGPHGGYDGFEICRWKVEHLDRTFTPAHPNFRFTWADVRNTFYNPSGSTLPDAYRFPYPDRTFDVVYAASVFTHMAPEGADRYVREAARVLKPGGRCVFSFFLLDHYRPGRPRPLGFAHPRFDFAHRVEPWGDEFATVVPSNPEQMTAYRLSLVERFAADAALELARPVLPGVWSGSADTWVAAQDLVVLRPRGSASRPELGEPH